MATTIKRIYTLALAKIIEAPGTDVDYDSYSPPLLDSLLVEALPYENAIRAQRGDEELTSAPEITTIDSTVLDWDDRITRVALPWGLAAALLFFENASGGGTDIVAMIIKKYSTMNISGALFVVDCVIVVVSFMVFDLTTGLCSVLGLMAKTLMIDKSIERMKLNKYFTIISSKPDEICEFIMNGLERSATVYHGEGVYSHKDKKIILTVVDVRQAVLLQRFIDEVDPQAFLMVTKSSEVVGKGFMSYI